MTKERNMATFKVGDRVRLTADGLAHWGDQASGTTGTITPEDEGDGWVYVEWGNGRVECYLPDRDLTLADPAPAGPRYVVRAASEMREGDVYNFSVDEKRIAEEQAHERNKWKPDHGSTASIVLHSRTKAWCLVDTHAHVPNGAPTPSRTAPPPPAPVEPHRPSDAAVCAAWEAVANWRETCRDPDAAPLHGYTSDGRGLLTVGVEATETTRADYQAARSRELKRLAAASAETERLRVVVQCQDGGADDV